MKCLSKRPRDACWTGKPVVPLELFSSAFHRTCQRWTLTHLTHLYKCSLIKLFFQGLSWHAPSYLSRRVDCLQQQIFFRLKHGLIASSFASKYVQKSISYKGAVLWNAIGRSNRSIILECTGVKSFSKNVNCHTF